MQTLRRFIDTNYRQIAQPLHIAMPRKSFRTHVESWMRGINMPMTRERELFLQRYEALLRLRKVSRHELGCRRAAMEVLLNLSRHPSRQLSYLKSMIRALGKLIEEHLALGYEGAHGHNDNWDVPGHVVGSGFRFSVIEDAVPGAMPPRILDMSPSE
jgi:hypothetical protein